MKILLATGIYPPDIGGPATYCKALAAELVKKGWEVVVVSYGSVEEVERSRGREGKEVWEVIRVSKWGGSLLRWRRYAKALKKYGADADIVYAFSSVSCGIPLLFSRLPRSGEPRLSAAGPRRILRLGGDFLWERYTDRGGMKTLAEFYSVQGGWVERCRLKVERWLMQNVLQSFDHVVFSTQFQKKIYTDAYKKLPLHSIIENVLQPSTFNLQLHAKRDPFRLLFLGRLVPFKNLSALLEAMVKMPSVRLTIVGSGPRENDLKKKAEELMLTERVHFLPPVHGEEKQKLFSEFDLLVLPSLTEISPNTALEARAAGMPVLLTEETGLSEQLRSGMHLAPLRTPIEIMQAVSEASAHYSDLAQATSEPLPGRSWEEVAGEHVQLFQSLE